MFNSMVSFAALGLGIWSGTHLLDQPALVVAFGAVFTFFIALFIAKFAKTPEPAPYISQSGPPAVLAQTAALRYAEQKERASPRFLYRSAFLMIVLGIPAVWVGWSEYDKFLSQPLLGASFLFLPGAIFGLAACILHFARKETSREANAGESTDG